MPKVPILKYVQQCSHQVHLVTASKTKPKNSTSNLLELKQKLDEKKREGAGKGTLKILEAEIERLERNEKAK